MLTNTPIQISDILLNAQEMHESHPDTFYAPSQAELATIVAGCHVKVDAIIDPATCGASGERFWVYVDEVKDTSIIGEVRNTLIWSSAHKLNFGHRVEFDFSAVMNILL